MHQYVKDVFVKESGSFWGYTLI